MTVPIVLTTATRPSGIMSGEPPSPPRGAAAAPAVNRATPRVELFDAGGVLEHIAPRPPAAELLTSGRQLTHQVVKLLVARVPSSLRSEAGNRHIGHDLPIRGEVALGSRN